MSLGNECGHGKANLSCTAILLDDSADSDSELAAGVACIGGLLVELLDWMPHDGLHSWLFCGEAEVRTERGPADIPAEQPI